MLSEEELGAGQAVVEDCHDRHKHLGRDIGVEVNVVCETELAELFESTLEESFNVFLLLGSLQMVHGLAL